MRRPRPALEDTTTTPEGRRQELIASLQAVRDRSHRLPPEALERIAAAAMDERLRRPGP